MPEHVTDEQLIAWQVLADRASGDPWDTVLSSDGVCVSADDGRDGIAGHLLVDDARFIAVSRTAVPALIAAVREARAERDAAVTREKRSLLIARNAVRDARAERDRARRARDVLTAAQQAPIRRADKAIAERDALARRIEAVRGMVAHFEAEFHDGQECPGCMCEQIRDALDGEEEP
ncbi:hypothetical protein [Brachybacterium hainanense]|uniref:Uncharacterized protein n=1 Tax=Brachybacterium hainanense TaxID=1541174 RepID=A0ABV6RAY0_9MICO